MVVASLAVAALLAAVLGAGTATAQGEPAVRIEVRVWQNVGNERDIRISARPADGSWRTLGTVRLYLNDGFSGDGRYRYGDTSLDVPLASWAISAMVEVRVWQSVNAGRRVYVSARPTGGSWLTLGTIRLPLDDGLSSDGRFRFGDVGLDVPLPTVAVSTLAGRPGVHGFADGQGSDARFGWLRESGGIGLAVDHDGSVIVADLHNLAIRRISLDGTVTTIAGGNGSGLRDGPGDVAQFVGPTDVAIDPQGSIYVADCWADRIRRITPDGMVTTIAGADQPVQGRFIERDGPAEQALFTSPCRIALDPYGDLYIAETFQIRRLSPSGWVSTFAGSSARARLKTNFFFLRDLGVDGDGNIYLIDGHHYQTSADGTQYAIQKIDTSGLVSTLFQSGPPQDGGVLASPERMVVTNDGDVYLSNTGRNQILRFSQEGELTAVAGTGEEGHLDGPQERALFFRPGALALFPSGALAVVDQNDSTIRIVRPNANGAFTPVEQAAIPVLRRLENVRVSLVAGVGGRIYRYAPGMKNGPAEEASFFSPRGIALDASGGVIIADMQNHAIRRISPDGNVTTVAGGNGKGARDGPREVAQFSSPWDVTVDADGSIYVADRENDLIRRIGTDGVVTTVDLSAAGTLDQLQRVMFDPDGNLLITETGRLLSLAPDGTLSTVLELHHLIYGLDVDAEGTPVFAFAKMNQGSIQSIGEDGVPFAVFEDQQGIYGGVFSGYIAGLAVAPDGTLYAVDWRFGRVVRISQAGEAVIVAERSAFNNSRHFHPADILITPEGDLLVADSGTSTIWKITLPDEDDE